MPRARRLPAGPRRIALDDAEVVGFGDADAEDDRIDLRDGRQQRALAAADEAARLHLRRADQAVDRRHDPRVAEIERRLLHRGLGRVDLRSRGVLRARASSSSCWLTACFATSGV